MRLNWNFQRGGGHRANPFHGGGGGGYGYFLEPHIVFHSVNLESTMFLNNVTN